MQQCEKSKAATLENNNVGEEQCAKRTTCEVVVQEAILCKECEQLQQFKINDNNVKGMEVTNKNENDVKGAHNNMKRTI
jgi:hypothetical protein